MFEAVKTMLSQTPWWVYLLLWLLIQRGIAASKTQVVPLAKMAIIPVLFTGLSLYTIINGMHINALSIGTWVLAIGLGAFAGWIMVRNIEFPVDKENKLIKIPGSWRTLILILLVFIIKYFFNFLLGANPAIANHLLFSESMITASGFCSGMFVGNFICYMSHFFNGPYTQLKPTNS